MLDGLTLRATERLLPGPGQVEIRVLASALNFSDVMKALGLYPGLPDGPVSLGAECAGRISAIGPDVKDFKIGDEVIAIAPASFASHVLTHTAFVVPKPDRLTFEESATIPIAYLTADYALNYLGRMTAGERVLIHAASGGVGLAAIQLARRAGAEVFATAGNPEKRQFLQALGVKHVMDSRSLSFADEIMELTAGKGVDLILNSLPGEAIAKGLSVLSDYGRFLEIGKRDIYGNSRIGLKPFRKNLSFLAIDLDRAIRERPALLAALFKRLVQDIAAGQLHALPHRVFAVDSVVSAFRFLSKARQIGKVVLSLEQQPQVAPDDQAPLRVTGDATYLLTGGLGGFGLAAAQWLVAQGARHLVLMGRRGIHSDETARQVEELRQAGAEVVVAKADVTKEAEVAAVVADISRNMPPLRGVMHAAMVLEDCLLLKLDQERWLRIVEPKVNGAWNLHRQTLHLPLDFFVLFSSTTSVFGLPGQASYSAANAFLDALAYYRRSRGLPALTVNWGLISEVGWVARNEKVAERLGSQGIKSIPPRQALAALGGLLRQGGIQVSVAHVDASIKRILGTSGTISRRFPLVAKDEDGQEAGRQDGAAIRKAVLEAQPGKRQEVLVAFLCDKVARVLGTSAARLAIDKPLTDLGLDSLMAVELRNWIEGELRVDLPIVELMQGPTITRMAELLLARLTPGADGPKVELRETAAAKPDSTVSNGVEHKVDGEKAEEALANLDRLSDTEVESMLGAILAEKEQSR